MEGLSGYIRKDEHASCHKSTDNGGMAAMH